MRLKYELTVIDMDGELTAVPTGKGADDFHGILKLNETAAEILEQLKEDTTPEKVHEYLKNKHPETDGHEIGNMLAAFLNQLIREGLLIFP